MSINYFLTRCAREDNVQACRILLSYNVDPSIVSLQGYTAAQIAAENVLKILQGKIFNLISGFIFGRTIFIFKFNFIDPPNGTDDVEAQLLEASKSGDLAAVERILQANPHAVNCRDLDGRHSTPLHFAAGFNRVPVVEYLLAHGADVHAKDKG